ncbi:MAG: peptidase serine carboxypeptidase [Hyphomicrobiales bacterium]|nr:peptidase serine carboxypeptidase [Hyphomicrobiales bacterium]
MNCLTVRLLAASLLLASPLPLAAQPADHEAASQQTQPRGSRGSGAPEAARPSAERLKPLPPDSTTRHTISVDGRPLSFTATAGTIRLYDAQQGNPQADIATLAFRRDDSKAETRPVTFVFNGGPGYASGWLNLGAIGPWRLRMDAEAAYPSAPPITVENAETWLDFTDLVFIDPPGTGYSRILGGDEVRKRFFGVDGDIDVLAATIRRWVEENDRMLSPKFIAGESYGGFRAPKIAHALQTDQGLGINGLVLISPVLDFARFNSRLGLFDNVARLPSYAATARQLKGQSVTRNDLADVEAYARGDYLADLMRGVKDPAVIDRMSHRVADLTGLDFDTVRKLGARVPVQVFLREIDRKNARVGSQYDATVMGYDPTPFAPRSGADDQMRLGLHAPITQAMVALYHDKLAWKVESARYLFMNEQASRQWDWGHGQAEAVGDLRDAMALDPHMRVLVAQGLTDVVTPYFETQMVLDQMPDYGAANRLRFRVYQGGHMFYSRDDSRAKFRDDARSVIVR